MKLFDQYCKTKAAMIRLFLFILTSSKVFCQFSMLLWPNFQCCFLSFSHVCYSLLFNRSSSVVVQGIRKQLKISAKNNQRSCSDKSRYTHTNVVYLDLGALSSFLFFSGMKGRSRGRNCKCTSRYCVNCILSLPAIVKSCTAFKYVVRLTLFWRKIVIGFRFKHYFVQSLIGL